MSTRSRRFVPILAIALLLIGGVIFLVFVAPEHRAPEPRPDPLLADLGSAPNWNDLDKYNGVLTREEFEKALREVYALGTNWHAAVSEEGVLIESELQPAGQFIEFATSPGAKSPPRYWRPADELPPAPPAKPLADLRIAIDPGHIGGAWAKMEERWYRIGETKPVAEGDMTLRTAKLLKPRLEELGATVILVRGDLEPVTRQRPPDFLDYAAETMRGAPESEIQKKAERLFYRTAEIRARAKLINEEIRPDLVLCLHFNAEGWGGDPTNPLFSPRNHFHMILHGAYMEGEIAHEDERFEMMHKVFQKIHPEEAALATELAKSFLQATDLSPYRYAPGKPAIEIGPALWARNLLANRLYQCPVLFFEPYVMNNKTVYQRVQAGDYEGTREVAGKVRKSIYREYADAVVQGMTNYYQASR